MITKKEDNVGTAAVYCAAVFEDGDHEPRNVGEVAPKTGKSKELGLPLEPLEGAWSCPWLNFIPGELILDGPEKL